MLTQQTKALAKLFVSQQNTPFGLVENTSPLYGTIEEPLSYPPNHSRKDSAISTRNRRSASAQIMPSETNIDMPASTLDDLCDQIGEGMLPQTDDDTENQSDDWDLEFIPETVLKNLISTDAVGNVLRHSKEHHRLQLNTPIPELAQWFSENAVKLFAILADNHQLHLIEHMYHERIRDDMLPVKGRKKGKTYEMKPCKKSSDDDQERVCRAFQSGAKSPWGPRGVDHFYLVWQWRFVSPVFLKDEFRYDFQPQVRLPFTRIGVKNLSQNSLYSHVQEMSVHADHLPKDLVRHPAPSYLTNP